MATPNIIQRIQQAHAPTSQQKKAVSNVISQATTGMTVPTSGGTVNIATGQIKSKQTYSGSGLEDPLGGAREAKRSTKNVISQATTGMTVPTSGGTVNIATPISPSAMTVSSQIQSKPSSSNSSIISASSSGYGGTITTPSTGTKSGLLETVYSTYQALKTPSSDYFRNLLAPTENLIFGEPDTFIKTTGPNISPGLFVTGRGTQITDKGFQPAEFRSTSGMTPGEFKITREISAGITPEFIGLPDKVKYEKAAEVTSSEYNKDILGAKAIGSVEGGGILFQTPSGKTGTAFPIADTSSGEINYKLSKESEELFQTDLNKQISSSLEKIQTKIDIANVEANLKALDTGTFGRPLFRTAITTGLLLGSGNILGGTAEATGSLAGAGGLLISTQQIGSGQTNIARSIFAKDESILQRTGEFGLGTFEIGLGSLGAYIPNRVIVPEASDFKRFTASQESYNYESLSYSAERIKGQSISNPQIKISGFGVTNKALEKPVTVGVGALEYPIIEVRGVEEFPGTVIELRPFALTEKGLEFSSSAVTDFGKIGTVRYAFPKTKTFDSLGRYSRDNIFFGQRESTSPISSVSFSGGEVKYGEFASGKEIAITEEGKNINIKSFFGQITGTTKEITYYAPSEESSIGTLIRPTGKLISKQTSSTGATIASIVKQINSPLITPTASEQTIIKSVSSFVTPSLYAGKGLYERTSELAYSTSKQLSITQSNLQRTIPVNTNLLKPTSNEKLSTIVPNISKTRFSVGLIQPQVQQPRLSLIQRTPLLNSPGNSFPGFPSTINPLLEGSLFGGPFKFSFNESGAYKQSKGKRIKYGYQPSLTAGLLGIKAPRMPKQIRGFGGYSGLSISPLVVGVKRKRRKKRR